MPEKGGDSTEQKARLASTVLNWTPAAVDFLVQVRGF